MKSFIIILESGVSMESNHVLYEKIRTFFYATSVPIRLIHQHKIIFSIPEMIECTPKIIDDSFDICSYKNFSMNSNDKTFFYRNEFYECYAVITITEVNLLLIGPVLNEEMNDNQINNIIRINKLPLKLSSKLMKHYNSQPIIDNKKFFNIGRLLMHLLSDNTIQNFPKIFDVKAFEPEEYFSKPSTDHDFLFHHPPYFLEQELLSKIKAGNLQSALLILKEINSLKRTKLSTDALRSIKNSLICSITLFTRASIEGGVLPELAFNLSDNLILEIEKIDKLSKLLDFEDWALEQYIKLVEEVTSKAYSNTIKKAISYINNNLTNRLALADISSEIFVHPNYLSSLFKKEVGMSLSDYITKARIEESKYYIQSTNTKITDVANFYHFCNQSYYTKAFKKFLGKTPHEYRSYFSHE